MAKKKSYDEDFKKMIVELYENKKPVVEIKREYGIAEATLYRWIKEYGKIKVILLSSRRKSKQLQRKQQRIRQEDIGKI